MRIDDNLASSGDLQSTQVDKTQQLQVEQDAKQKQGQPAKDSVSLSPFANDLAQAINNDPPELIRQIEQLRQAVNNGTFQVPADQIAQAVVNGAVKGD